MTLIAHFAMTIGAESPSPDEVRAQLERMLASKRFRTAWSQAQFLELVARRALEGKKTPGHIVAKTIFKGKFLKDESMDVRATANHLRATLKRYYAAEGRADLVCIALPDPPKDKSVKLPEGEAYTPTFSYNPMHSVGKEFKLGMHYLSRGMYEDYSRAITHFAAVLRLAPEHIGASIGMTEAYVSTLSWDREFNSGADIDILVEQAAGFLDRVHSRASRFWRLHAAGAFTITEQGLYLDRAKLAFDEALRLDRVSTEDYPPYFYFLVRTGEKSKAVHLAKQHLEAHPDSMAAHIACAKVYIRAERFPEAQAVLEKALAMDKGNYAVHLFLALLHLAQRRPEEVLGHVLQVKLLADDFTYRMAFRWCMQIVEVWPQHLKEEMTRLWDSQLRSISPSSGPSSA